jgi:hypothetical protein
MRRFSVAAPVLATVAAMWHGGARSGIAADGVRSDVRHSGSVRVVRL